MKITKWLTTMALVLAMLAQPMPVYSEAYCLNYAKCQPTIENQIYTRAYAVRQPDRSWVLHFSYYSYVPATARITVYGMSPYGKPVLLDVKIDRLIVSTSWSTHVPQCDIYYQVVGQIIILKDNQPIDSASVTLNQYDK